MILDIIDCAKINAYLTTNTITTILSDVFDTVLCRKTHPDTIKKIVAARLNDHIDSIPEVAFYTARQQAERYCYEKTNANFDDKEIDYAELTATIYDQLKATYDAELFLDKAAFCEKHRQIEMAVEERFVCADPLLLRFLAQQKQAGKKIILLSDFYMPRAWLSVLLASQGLGDIYSDLIVSADVFKTKHSGKLYHYLIETGVIDPASTIMLGDNYHSDVHMANKYGIKAFHINRKKQKKFYAKQEKSHASKRALLTKIEKITQQDPDVPFAYFPVLLLHIVHNLYVTCLKQGTTNLYFLAREGKIIKTLFDIYQQYLTGNEPSIKTHYLMVSRRSTFAASLRALEQEDFHTLFRQYVTLSIRQFALSLALDIDQITVFCQALNIDMDETHEHLPSSPSFQLLKQYPGFVAYYEATRIQQKANFLRYFQQLHPLPDEAPIHLFDVGWKGTMQDNLAKLFPNRTIRGFYIGLLGPGSSYANDYKTGLLFDYRNKTEIYRLFEENPCLFEVLLNAEHGSVVRYTPGETAVECDFNAKEQQMFQQYIRPMQEKIVRYFNQILPLFDQYTLGVKTIGAYCLQQHRRKTYLPDEKELQWFQCIEHFDNFGPFTYTKVAKYWLLPRLTRKKLRRLKLRYKLDELKIVYL